MAERLIPVEELLGLLRETPTRIAASTTELTPAELRTPPADGEWSAVEVLVHLRSCADVWGGCVTTMLAEDHPTFVAVNPTTWVKSTTYPALAFRTSWRAFTAQRAALLAVLDALPAAGWSRGATVSVAGKPYERTVHFYAQWLAKHERSHVKQFAKIAAALRR